MALDTKPIALTTAPINLAIDPDVRAAIAEGRRQVAMQNTSSGKSIFYAFRATAPTAGSRDGQLLRYGDGSIVTIEEGDALWVWSTTTATLAITGS